MAGAKVTDTDTGWIALLVGVKRLKSAETLRLGVNDDEHHGSNGLTNEEVGAFHEFGLGNNPERSFLRAWLDEEELWLPELEAEIGRELSISGSGAQRTVAAAKGAALGPGWAQRFGPFCVESIRDRVYDHLDPPLSDATRERGRDDPALVDTEQLMGAIEFDVKGRA